MVPKIIDSIGGMLQPKSKPKKLPEVKLGIIGTSTAGKTYLVTAINSLVLGGKLVLTDGLEIAVINGIDTTTRLEDVKDTVNLMKQQALSSTVANKEFHFRLIYGIDDVVAITYHDHVGQVLEESDSDKDQLRANFVRNIAESNVVWFLLPLQVDSTGRYIGVLMDDIVLAKAYFRDGLRQRVNSGITSPLVFAIALTKVDVLGTTGLLQEKQELVDIYRDLKAHFQGIVGSEHISVAAIFPISVLGFENTEFVNEHDKSEFLLAGKDLQPYNVDRLLLWSLLSVTYQENSQVDEKVRRSILKNLSGLSGFMYSFKD